MKIKRTVHMLDKESRSNYQTGELTIGEAIVELDRLQTTHESESDRVVLRESTTALVVCFTGQSWIYTVV